ncbi:MAG: hypothetical protein WD029_07050, partial [Microthrixaceae bacterium]
MQTNRDTSLAQLDPSSLPTIEAIEAPSSHAVKGNRLGTAAWVAIAWIAFLALLAVLAPVLPIPDPNQSFVAIARKGPTAGHWFGGDAIGRDLLSRIIWGTRSSFIVGFGAVAFGLVLGGMLGLLTGFFRGRVDGLITPLMNVLLAIPQFVLALSLVTVLASGAGVNSSRRLAV